MRITSRWIDLAWFLAAALGAGLFLFQVPGFHYDEAWFANYGARIAFEPGFWPAHGMSFYTTPVLPYMIAGVFRAVGAPSLETARLFYLALNLFSFVLFYGWVKKAHPKGAWVFALLWCTLPLSIFNQRLFLEVTTGYALFAGLALRGFSAEYFAGGRARLLPLAIGVLALIAGIASHILFFGLALGIFWALWKHQPEALEKPRAKWASSLVLAPTLLLFLQASFETRGTTTGAKAIIGSVGILAIGVMIWQDKWRQRIRPLALKAGSAVLYLAAGVGFFFFALFELSGIWPTSQTTGILNLGGLIPGIGILLLFFWFFRPRLETPLEKISFEIWLVTLSITILTVFKPSSARYWELPLLGFMLLAGLTWRPAARRQLANAALIGAGALNILFLGINYFGYTVKVGAHRNDYRMLWVKDRALDYRPVVPTYRALRAMVPEFCAEDRINVDDFRTASVLLTHRSFARTRGEEAACGARAPRTFVFSSLPEAGAKPLLPAGAPGLGDFAIYELNSTP